MMHPRTEIQQAMTQARDVFFDTLAARLASHEQHARTTSSEAAYQASMGMARKLRAAIAHLKAEDLDIVCSDLSAWVMVSECAETALRATKYAC